VGKNPTTRRTYICSFSLSNLEGCSPQEIIETFKNLKYGLNDGFTIEDFTNIRADLATAGYDGGYDEISFYGDRPESDKERAEREATEERLRKNKNQKKRETKIAEKELYLKLKAKYEKGT
jgi:hypothetical protein